jgi:hypothetical protein
MISVPKSKISEKLRVSKKAKINEKLRVPKIAKINEKLSDSDSFHAKTCNVSD